MRSAGVAAVEHAELRIELQLPGVVTQQAVADGMERARPAQALQDALADPAEGLVERRLGDARKRAGASRRRPAG